MRAPPIFFASLALLATPALAGDKPVQPQTNPTVLMSPVALPIVVDGKLVNYVFVTARLGLSPQADSLKMRAMEPYFRDAIVRAGHRTPFVRDDNYAALDDNRLKATLIRESNAIAGAGSIVSVQIIREQPQHYDGLPKPKIAPQRP
jgi:hypothetical protein